MAQYLDSNGTPNNLLNIGPNQSQLSHDPKQSPSPIRILLPAELRKVPARRHTKPGRKQLDQKAHDRGPQKQPQQRVTRDGTRLEIPLQIARIQKSYAHQEPGPCKQPQLLPRKRRRFCGVLVGVPGSFVDSDDSNLLSRIVGSLFVIIARIE
ncbi:hypothetical protein CASFOL_038770 [Castilleja foliolosa]|uniref:Uncharacterized protein n=1 Tax=Castilleja foliolosa TaxID=1961234 RepID=A0ABD3BKS3_9LAMI